MLHTYIQNYFLLVQCKITSVLIMKECWIVLKPCSPVSSPTLDTSTQVTSLSRCSVWYTGRDSVPEWTAWETGNLCWGTRWGVRGWGFLGYLGNCAGWHGNHTRWVMCILSEPWAIKRTAFQLETINLTVCWPHIPISTTHTTCSRTMHAVAHYSSSLYTCRSCTDVLRMWECS